MPLQRPWDSALTIRNYLIFLHQRSNVHVHFISFRVEYWQVLVSLVLSGIINYWVRWGMGSLTLVFPESVLPCLAWLPFKGVLFSLENKSHREDREGVKEIEPGYFQWCPEPYHRQWVRTEREKALSEYGEALRMVQHCHRFPVKVGKNQKLSGHISGQLALGGPAWTEGWTRQPPEIPFHFDLSFCDS